MAKSIKPIKQLDGSWLLGIRPFILKPCIEIQDFIWTSSVLRYDGKFIYTKNTRYEVKCKPEHFVTTVDRKASHYRLCTPEGKFLTGAYRYGNSWWAFGKYFNTLWQCRVFADIRYLKNKARQLNELN